MEYGIISVIPILILIVGIIVTKRLQEMLILSVFVSAILLYGTGFLTGVIELLYMAMASDTFQFLVLIIFGFGAMIAIFEKSGALLGFGNTLSKFATSPKKSLVTTWFLGLIIFIDDYLNALAVSSSMRSITDKKLVPREHLAYTVNATGACICVLVPFTSWSAFAVGVVNDYNLGFTDYVAAIPFMFYPLAAVVIALLLAVGLLPKVGLMKKAYERVEQGGPTMPEEKGSAIVKATLNTDVKKSSPLNFIIPIIVLVIVMMYFDNDLIHGIIAALVVQAIMYISQKIMTPTQFMTNFGEGLTTMTTLAFIILLALAIGEGNRELGLSEYMIEVFTVFISPQLLPLIAFLACGFIAFITGNFWALIVLVAPIFMPLSFEMGVNPSLMIAAIMSGVALGSQACFYSDAIFMTSAGTGVSPVLQVRTIMPYVLLGAVIATALFLGAGFIF
ncbi:hypothetical protein DH09_17870 [Bacillaceae bacterium JMAK1]|nr:hypothetical protein DH09_17870 [Bacillaceae bacterium JMAK1]